MRDVPAAAAFRMTPHRRAVLEVVRAAMDHPTADEVFTRLRRRRLDLSLGTVYRSLEALVRAGLVRRHDLGARAARYDAVTRGHVHVACLHCGALADAEGLQALMDQLPGEVAGFQLRPWEITLPGICPRCRGVRESDSSQPAAGRNTNTL